MREQKQTATKIVLSDGAKKALAELRGETNETDFLEKLIASEYGRQTMSLKEAAQYLGYSENNLREKIKAKLIPAHRPFGKWIFTKRDLDKILTDSRQEIGTSTEQEAARRLAKV